jgi:hypothetical protein
LGSDADCRQAIGLLASFKAGERGGKSRPQNDAFDRKITSRFSSDDRFGDLQLQQPAGRRRIVGTSPEYDTDDGRAR